MKALYLSSPVVTLIAASLILPIQGTQGVGGWYIDETTCQPPQRAFLNKYLSRARIAHINVATYLGNYDLDLAFRAIAWNVIGGSDASLAWLTADAVFGGGFDPSQDGLPEIQGLASWNGPISEAEAINSPNGLIIYCRPDRLAYDRSAVRTYDSASATFYPVRLPGCPNGVPKTNSAAVLTHSAKNQPDRVTFCGWFINRAMTRDANNELWTTDLSMNGLRDLATRWSTGNTFDIGRWRQARYSRLRKSRGLLDLDVSVGFDTFLTSVLAHTSAGGLRGTIGGVGQEAFGNTLPPVSSWRVNQAVDAQERPGKALPYMLINAIINSMFAGFENDGNTGAYTNNLRPWYPNCNFMVDRLPFEHQACAQPEVVASAGQGEGRRAD